MSMILFVGGPWHGEVHDVVDENQHVNVLIDSEWSARPVTEYTTYTRQKFGDPRTKRMREAMVWSDLGYSHPRVEYEFRQALVTAWVNGRI